MEHKSITKDSGYDTFYNELSEIVTKDVKPQLKDHKPFIDDEINTLGISLIEKIKSAPPSKEKYRVKLNSVISTDKINKCIKKRILELFKITLVFERNRFTD
jgi:hypothetical protein